MSAASRPSCPHCHAPLSRIALDETLVLGRPYDLACFNDECPYYERGWSWMEQQFGVKVSYRYRIDPNNGYASPLAVWSREALRDGILDDASEHAGAEDHP